ncbi:MAG: hypothetical protein A2W99_12130 [Bacteroidetes bacterium GWF2_33_16]|nr:MAG: hypothetical protein A2X00_02145 [Bacteroidetes bacterium GWE2_32_14]OFY06446.1 MAG: hypothetical protein A2W99_12130 [Bacteroidetes bacterium GWF2_33_16]
MKRLIDIIKLKRNTNTLDIDELMDRYSLSYNDLDFRHTNIDTIKAYEKLNKSIEKSTIHNFSNLFSGFNWKPILKPIYTIALTSIIIIAVFYLKRETDETHYAEIIVEKGEKIKLNVEKNLVIWVNSGSYVRIPTNGKIGKEIYIEGEAFIEASPQNKINYSIISGNSICYIKNGSFNIKTNNKEVIATVSKGALAIYNTNLPKSTQITLKENDRATLFKNYDFIAVEKEKSRNYLYWKTGILQFNNTELRDVAKIVTEYFQIPVKIENIELRSEHVSATFTNPEIDDILDKIQSTINCQITGDGSKLIIY